MPICDTTYIPLPPQHELERRFNYNPENGRLTNKVPLKGAACVPGGEWAGHVDLRTGARYVRVGRHTYPADRIVWKMMTGDDPARVFHLDCDLHNCVWSNLSIDEVDDESDA